METTRSSRAAGDERDLLTRLPELWPETAPDRIRFVYDDLRTSLRVPDVPYPFRLLAHWPPYLAFAVRQFSPFIRTQAFEMAAQTLRELVVERCAALPALDFQSAHARSLVLREHALAPKLVLILTAFAVGLHGRTSEPAPILGLTLPDTEPVPVRPAELPRGIDDRVPVLPALSSIPANSAPLLDQLARQRGLPACDDLSRSLAVTDPAALGALVRYLQTLAPDDPERIIALADDCAQRLVRRFTLPGHAVLPDFMVPHDMIPAITATVDALRRLALQTLFETTVLRIALEGTEAARSDPFPLSSVAA